MDIANTTAMQNQWRATHCHALTTFTGLPHARRAHPPPHRQRRGCLGLPPTLVQPTAVLQRRATLPLPGRWAGVPIRLPLTNSQMRFTGGRYYAHAAPTRPLAWYGRRVPGRYRRCPLPMPTYPRLMLVRWCRTVACFNTVFRRTAVNGQ